MWDKMLSASQNIASTPGFQGAGVLGGGSPWASMGVAVPGLMAMRGPGNKAQNMMNAMNPMEQQQAPNSLGSPYGSFRGLMYGK